MTTAQWNRRLLAGVGTGALAATVITGLHLGAGEAHAAPVTADGSVRVYHYNVWPTSEQWVDTSRTVSNSTVNQGDTVTITTTLSTHKIGSGLGGAVTVENIQDWTPNCLAYVPGTGKATKNNTIGGPVTLAAVAKTGYIETNTGAGAGWGLGTGGEGRTVTLTADYIVNCDPGQHETGGLNAFTSPSSDGAGLASNGWLDDRSTGTGVANPPSGLKNSGPTITVNAAATAPAAPISATITPDTTTNGGTVTVSGKAAANTDTVVVEVAGTPVTCTPATVAANGDYSCTFTATNSGEVTVAGKNDTDTGPTKSAGTLTVNTAQPGAPVVTVLPAPKVDQESTIGISAPDGNAGDDVTVTVNGHAICADLKLDANGKADCAWTPNSAGNAELKVTVNGKTTTTNLTVATTGGGNGGGGNGSSDGSSGSSEGSLGSSDGSLGDLFGGLFVFGS